MVKGLLPLLAAAGLVWQGSGRLLSSLSGRWRCKCRGEVSRARRWDGQQKWALLVLFL